MHSAVKIVDSTLRDGEQQAGIALSVKEKVAIAKLLSLLPVTQLEVGTPAMGGSELAAIEAIAKLNLPCQIAVWNRLHKKDIYLAIESGAEIIHLSAPASDIMLKSKLKWSRQWLLEQLVECISWARSKGATVSVGFEDASRADQDFLCQAALKAQEAGAIRVRLADTVGVLTPARTQEMIQAVVKHLTVPIAFHGHNDFGMAISNSLAAVSAGAGYVDCTVGGVGERAGNCNLLHFLWALDKGKLLEHNVDWQSLHSVEQRIMPIFT